MKAQLEQKPPAMPQQKRATNILSRLWDLITRPHLDLQHKNEQRQARLLASMLFIAITVGGAALAFVGITKPFVTDDLDYQIYVASMGLLLSAYLLSRTRHYRLGAIVFVVVLFATYVFVPFFENAQNQLLAFSVLAILVMGLFFSLRWVIIVGIAQVVSIFFLIQITPLLGKELDYIVMLQFVILMDTMIVTFIHHLSSIESERRAELEYANDQLRQSEAMLEQRVRERTQELQIAKDEADTARERAEEADRVKSQFLASMSHELRTPLNAILNFTEMMSLGFMGEVNDQQKDVLQKSLGSGQHLLGLINDVLDITKMESGMTKLFIEKDIDLYQELDTVIASVEALLENKPVTFVKKIDPDLPKITADKRRIRQILLNLLTNAAKFTEEGSITLRVENRGDEILASVIDTGPGIPKEQQELIFEPFEQTETGIRHGGGTGLGLPISKRLAEAHGGRLWVDSIEGKGSTFYVLIPAKAAIMTR